EHLVELHHAKTGELLLVSVRAGARMGGATADQLERLTLYGRALGLAFQIVDDVLDVTADLATLGKDPGSDREAGKTTFVDLLGVDGARARARQAMADGLAALARFGERARPPEALGRYTVQRDRSPASRSRRRGCAPTAARACSARRSCSSRCGRTGCRSRWRSSRWCRCSCGWCGWCGAGGARRGWPRCAGRGSSRWRRSGCRSRW